MHKMELTKEAFEKMVNLTPELLCISKKDGHFKYVNPAFEKILGYSEDEMMNLTIYDIIHQDDIEEVHNSVRKMEEEKKEYFKFEYRYICKDGSIKWIAWNVSPRWDEELVYAAGNDITERKAMESELSHSNEKLDNILNNVLNNANAIITQIDKNGKFLFSKGKVLRDTGYISEDLKGKSVFEMQSKSNFILDKIQRALNGEELNLEYKINEITFDCRFTPLKDKNGSPDGGIVIATDITERKRVEEELRKIKGKYKELANNVPAGILSYDLDGNITFINHKILEIAGTTWGHENMSANVFTFPALVQYGINDVFKKCIENNELVIAEKEYKSTFGKASILRIQTAPIRNDEGKVISGIAIIEDFTERKKLEIDLQLAKEQAELSSRVKSEFLANMSHEIRTPMNGIMGMSDLLKLTKLTHEQSEMINIIKDSSDSLLNIINDILDLSKIDAGKVELRPQLVNFIDSINSLSNVFRVLSKEKGLDFYLNIANDVPREIIIDNTRLIQVMNNLIGNAIKFTQNGSVAVSVKKIKTIGNKAKLMFSVSDTGIGIQEEDVLKVFDYFTQLDNFLTKRFQGTGLGLAISKRLVELMGGEISVESEYGKGSTFYFTILVEIPKSKQAISPPNHVDITGESGATIKILLVEDDYVSQLVIKQICKLKGWSVEVVNNGYDALTILDKYQFDLILMDIQMAEMSGFEVSKIIRGNEEITGSRIPIIATTSYAMSEDKEKCLRVGMDDYISKPIDMEKLCEAIKRWTMKH